MSAGIDIKQEMAAACSANASIQTLVFVDVTAEMVLTTASATSNRQEVLDQLARQSKALLANACADGEKAHAQVSLLTALDTRLFLAGPPNSGEAIAVVASPSADHEHLVSQMQRLALLIWSVPEGAS